MPLILLRLLPSNWYLMRLVAARGFLTQVRGPLPRLHLEAGLFSFLQHAGN
jgi:hypothetical protein